MSRLLKDDDAIREWVEARGGYPLMMDVPDGTGESRTLLQLTFGQEALNADDDGERDGGFTLVGWDDWLRALHAQKLALLVSDDPAGGREREFQIVAEDEADRIDSGH